MKKALKELIEGAEVRKVGYFDLLMFVSNGVYDGFWGKNGYDKILILGYDKNEEKWYKVSDNGDIFNIYRVGYNSFDVEIDSRFGVPTIWFNKPVYIDNSMELSSVTGALRGRNEDGRTD